jgi:hypothetical protein
MQMFEPIAHLRPLPVDLAFISCPIQEFRFGAAALQKRGVPILAAKGPSAHSRIC